MREIDTAIITGATGMIGCALVGACHNAGISVIAVIRPGSSNSGRLPSDSSVRIVECSLDNLLHLDSKIDAVGHPAAFFHLGWEGAFGESSRNDADLQYANIGYSLDAVTAASRLGCKVFVGAGSQAEYGPQSGVLGPASETSPITGYGIAKLCAGRLCALKATRLGLDFGWARIFSIFGPNDNPGTLISMLLRTLPDGEDVPLTSCEQLWDYLYVDDAASALLKIAQNGIDQKTYCVASGLSNKLRAYVEAAAEIIGLESDLKFGELASDPEKTPNLIADIDALKEDTGFFPEVSFAEGIKRTLDWHRSIRLETKEAK